MTAPAEPKRIQRKRTKGWKMPPNTVYVGRPSIWGNPYQGDVSVGRFTMLCAPGLRAVAQKELRGKNLCCWCPLDQPCHADVLLELANK